MSLELLFLGTGTSAGVPMIACDCAVCRSSDPRDQRTRPSVLVRYLDASDASLQRQLLIDCSPEMRLQMVRHDVRRLDGVLITHAHADHILGLDDLRRFNAAMESPIDLYAESAVLGRLREMFRYIFDPQHNVNSSFVATLIGHALEPAQPLELFGARWTPLRLMHGRLPVLGFRVDLEGRSLAYLTDLSAVPPETWPLLEGLDVLVIDALRYRHHPLHLSVEQALEVISQVRPRRSYFTHIAHDVLHADLQARLPENVYLGYDGLTVRCGEPVTR